MFFFFWGGWGWWISKLLGFTATLQETKGGNVGGNIQPGRLTKRDDPKDQGGVWPSLPMHSHMIQDGPARDPFRLRIELADKMVAQFEKQGERPSWHQ